jgi:hypothetical protein
MEVIWFPTGMRKPSDRSVVLRSIWLRNYRRPHAKSWKLSGRDAISGTRQTCTNELPRMRGCVSTSKNPVLCMGAASGDRARAVVRRRPFSLPGIQVVVDHRPSGSMGGFYGGGIGIFHAIPFTFDAPLDESGHVNALREDEDDPSASYESLRDKAISRTCHRPTKGNFLSADRG